VAALAKPTPTHANEIGDVLFFDPWEDVINGISGGYASECDELLIGALKAARDRTTFEFVKAEGFAAELMLYVLAGHGLLEYGTSPRGGWPDQIAADVWQTLIDQCEAYAAVLWHES
jgi:hypothetical protein